MPGPGTVSAAGAESGRPWRVPDVSGWSDLVVGEPLTRGARNPMWLAERGGEKLVVRGSTRSPAAVAWELDLLVHLATQGVGVAPVVPADDGRRHVDGVIVQRFIPGPPPRSEADRRTVAVALRRVHEVTVGWPQRPGSASAASLLAGDVGGDVLLDLLPEADRALVRRAWTRVVAGARTGGAEPAGDWSRPAECVVHGDPAAADVRLGPTGAVLVAWDEARVDLPGFDEGALPEVGTAASGEFITAVEATATSTLLGPAGRGRWAAVSAALAWQAAACWTVEPERARRALDELRRREHEAGGEAAPELRVHSPENGRLSTGASPAAVAGPSGALPSRHAARHDSQPDTNQHADHARARAGHQRDDTAPRRDRVSSVSYAPGRQRLDDWLSLPEDEQGWLTELLDGHIVVTPPPSTDHQDIELELAVALRTAISDAARNGELRVYTGIGVGVGPHGLVPDLTIVRPPFRRELLVPAGRVALAVEIVSPHSQRRDRLSKPAAYAGAGIPYYWRIEPDHADGPTLVTYRLADGVDRRHKPLYIEGETLHPGAEHRVSASPVPVVLDPGRLLPHR